MVDRGLFEYCPGLSGNLREAKWKETAVRRQGFDPVYLRTIVEPRSNRLKNRKHHIKTSYINI